jgi:hypothetical protein
VTTTARPWPPDVADHPTLRGCAGWSTGRALTEESFAADTHRLSTDTLAVIRPARSP